METLEQRELLGCTPRETRFDTCIKTPLSASKVDILQINLGRRCNLSCMHCHVQAGPDRREEMNLDLLEQCLDVIRTHPISTIDITGGAPEMNPNLAWFIEQVSKHEKRLLVRTNLVILQDSDKMHFLDCYARNGVELVASLPDYRREKVDRIRGQAVFDRAIQVMRQLNELGYSHKETGLILHLAHNPAGAYLPGNQQALEHEYRNRLQQDYGVVFDSLFTLTNCPVGRYLDYLVRSDNFEEYMQTLVDSFNPNALRNVMCRTSLSVGWDGKLYDCDFNQMLEMPVENCSDHISDFDYNQLSHRSIAVDNHCFSCTAGSGSSCQGALD